jgi:predicted metal-dependent hydrolase
MATVPHETGRSSEELAWICRAAIEATFPVFRNAVIEARFYPYVGLTHTIRRTGQGWILRVSDHCRRAPRMVIEAIALILASKILRKRPSIGLLEVYDRFRKSPEVEESVHARRRQRGRKMINSSEGRHHSLMTIYRELNHRYFGDQVEIRKLGWGPKRSWGRLGHYDPVHNTITISPVLDSAQVPRFVVAFIVYHEMLHTLFGNNCPSEGRNRHHPSGFRKTEKSYPDYASAKRFLSTFCRTRGGACIRRGSVI